MTDFHIAIRAALRRPRSCTAWPVPSARAGVQAAPGGTAQGSNEVGQALAARR